MCSKGEALRQRVVATADGLFYRQGYKNTSFSDIANAVGISRGNFYYHFKSKDKILHAVIDSRVASLSSMLSEWDKKFADPKQRLHYYIGMLLRDQESIRSHGCPVGSLCTELAKTHPSMRDDANRMFLVFRNWLIVQLKLLGVKNVKQVAMQLLARNQGIATIMNAFEDKKFALQEVKQMQLWLDDKIPKSNHQPP